MARFWPGACAKNGKIVSCCPMKNSFCVISSTLKTKKAATISIGHPLVYLSLSAPINSWIVDNKTAERKQEHVLAIEMRRALSLSLFRFWLSPSRRLARMARLCRSLLFTNNHHDWPTSSPSRSPFPLPSVSIFLSLDFQHNYGNNLATTRNTRVTFSYLSTDNHRHNHIDPELVSILQRGQFFFLPSLSSLCLENVCQLWLCVISNLIFKYVMSTVSPGNLGLGFRFFSSSSSSTSLSWLNKAT